MFNVLIIDDNIKRAKKAEIELKNKTKSFVTINTQISENTNDAERKLKNSKYELLIVDIKLPKKKGDSPTEINTYKLIDKISNGKLNSSETLIGITSEISEIKNYKEEFEKICSIVLDAHSFNTQWIDRIANHIKQKISFIKIKESQIKKGIITIHGIRSYGEWQKKLNENLSCTGIDEKKRFDYEIVNSLSIFSKKVAQKNIKKLEMLIKSVAEEKDKIYLFSHSFGTYITLKAVINIIDEGEKTKHNISTIIISGSVVDQSFNFDKITNSGIKIVNDCATSDYTLYLSKVFIPRLGMIGKTGINSFSNRITNRFITGGHSAFFDDDYIENFWVPIVVNDEIKDIDLRKANIFINGYLEKIISFIGNIKNIFFKL
jgi:CheY-like chemotaxis protein